MTETFVRPNVTADMVIPNEQGEILLIKRKNPPYQNHWAIPGGFLEVHKETVEACAIREAEEETGLKVEIAHLIGVYSEPERDPRWHNVTAAYLAKPISMKKAQTAHAGDDAGDTLWIDPRNVDFHSLPLAFDHDKILQHALTFMP